MNIKKIILIIILFFLISGCSDSQVNNTAAVNPGTEIDILKDSKKYYNYSENVVTHKNDDGSKTIYVYSTPIEKNYDHINDMDEYYHYEGLLVNNYFPKKLSKNTPLKSEQKDDFISIVPIENNEYEVTQKNIKNAFGQVNQAYKYTNMFGKGTEYRCWPTSFGINTEIVLSEYNGENIFKIKIQLPVSFPDMNSPDYIMFKNILDDQDENDVRSLIYTPFAIDKNKKWSYRNSVKLLEKEKSTNIYTVQYTIDEEFLKNAKYPVTLNQSIYLYTPKQPDTSAYEKTGDDAHHYLSPYLFLGDRTPKGKGLAYIRYEILNEMDILLNDIVSAKYVFHNLLDSSKQTYIRAYAVTSEWCSINTRWHNRSEFDEKPVSQVAVKKKGDYNMDITSLFKEMIKNKGNPNKKYTIDNGFVIKSDTKDSNIILSSGDSGLYSPYLEIVVKN